MSPSCVISTFLLPIFTNPSTASLVVFSVTMSSLPFWDTVVISFSPSTATVITFCFSNSKVSSVSYLVLALICSLVTLVVLAISSIFKVPGSDVSGSVLSFAIPPLSVTVAVTVVSPFTLSLGRVITPF